MVLSYKYLGVLLTPTLSWTKHVQLLISRSNRLLAQCVAWCRASIFRVYVLPNVSWGSEFFAHSPAAQLTLCWCANLDGLTLNTWRWDDSSPFWDALDVHSPVGPPCTCHVCPSWHPFSPCSWHSPLRVRRWVNLVVSPSLNLAECLRVWPRNFSGACAVLEPRLLGS